MDFPARSGGEARCAAGGWEQVMPDIARRWAILGVVGPVFLRALGAGRWRRRAAVRAPGRRAGRAQDGQVGGPEGGSAKGLAVSPGLRRVRSCWPGYSSADTSIRARPSVPGKRFVACPRAMDAPASPPDRKRRRRDSPHTLPPIRQLYLPNTTDPAPFGVYPQYSLPPMAVEQEQYDSEGEDTEQRGPPKKKRRRQALSCTGNASALSCAPS